MNFLKKLFGKKEPWSPPKESPPPAGAPAMMKVWDAYGRIGEIPREEWRIHVLPVNFQNAWNKPDDLAKLIHVTLHDGFIIDCLEPARQLYRIDGKSKQAADLLSFVLIRANKVDEAEEIINRAITEHGKDCLLLNNLAKVHNARGHQEKVEHTLWESLQLDPNLENSFGWYVAIHRERGGEEAELEAMRRIASIVGSWRAQIWLARAALHSRDSEGAIKIYRELLSSVGKPIPADLLMQMSGDLGKTGHLLEALQLTSPQFVPEQHGLKVGNNLIKAHFDLGQIDAAQRILDQLYALNRTDWKENLQFWDTEIAKLKIDVSPRPSSEEMKVAMLTIDGPIWLDPSSPAAELFPTSVDRQVNVAFIGCSVETATNSKRIQQQMTDAPGRLSRALPLCLAEGAYFSSNACVQTLVPWIVRENGGFVLMGDRCPDEDAVAYAQQTEDKNDYAVLTHIKAIGDSWTVELRLVQTIDAKCVGELSISFPATKPEEGLLLLKKQLLNLLERHAEVELVPAPNAYQLPGAPHFGDYLVRLEQLLAVRCAGMDGMKNGLNGEREIIDGNLQLCLDSAENVTARILLAQTLLAMKKVRPDVLREFKEKIALLQKEKKLPEPAQGVVQRLINEAFA